MKRDYLVGDFVTYKQNGICRICAIVKQNFAQMGEKEYFELRPVYDEKTVVFVPKDSQILTSTMRRILTEEEIRAIIDESELKEIEWIENTKDRSRQYEDIINEGDRRRILCIIKTLYLHKASLEEKQRKMYATDARILALAEKIIADEFSFVLGIDRKEVIKYIVERIKK